MLPAKQGRSHFTFQLCITINDIEQVRRSLKPLPEALKFNEIVKGTERAMGETNAKGARMQLFSIIKHADDNMIKRIKQVVDKVADRVSESTIFVTLNISLLYAVDPPELKYD